MKQIWVAVVVLFFWVRGVVGKVIIDRTQVMESRR